VRYQRGGIVRGRLLDDVNDHRGNTVPSPRRSLPVVPKPMNVKIRIATIEEVREFLKRNPRPFLLGRHGLA
jgi:hypothetical protein